MIITALLVLLAVLVTRRRGRSTKEVAITAVIVAFVGLMLFGLPVDAWFGGRR